jgi:nifR3 family TIM-barrel protein
MQIGQLAQPLAFGGVSVSNRVFLAPMSGISDRPFRELALGFGAGMVVSEMIASAELATGNPEAVMRAERATSGLHVVQLAGREAHWMAEGARAATDAGADVIDINMGCPAKKVTGGYSGSALMRDLDLAVRLIDATVAATARPVTLKMRLGWDDRSINAPELARRAEAAGVQLITVHGRTRCQFYAGHADWAAIRAVKDAVRVPVVANGDVVSESDLPRLLALSGADAVMVGRGTQGAPWLPGALAAHAGGRPFAAPGGAVLRDLVLAHYEAILQHYGPFVGAKAARKHLGWYMDRAGSALALRQAVMTEPRPAAVTRLLAQAFSIGAERSAA